MSTLVMAGLENLEGGQTNTLRIGRMIRRRPQPVYETHCSQCDAVSSATHTRLRNGAATCRAAACGKPTEPRDNRTLERLDATARENARLAEEREASARRMEFESEGWERPTKYKPSPTPYQPRTDRERMELRERRAVEEAEEAERLRPIREAEESAERERVHKLRDEEDRRVRQEAYWRDVVLTEADPKVFISPELTTVSMPTSKADAFNAEQVQKFIAETPEYNDYRTPASSNALLSYLKRNGVNIADAATYRAAFVRCRDLGILTKRPVPAPEKPAPQPRRVNLSSEPPKQTPPKDDGSETGWDWTTGQPLTLTARQVLLMSSADYRRFKKLDKAALEFPGRLV